MRDRKEIEEVIKEYREILEALEEDGQEWGDDWYDVKTALEQLEWCIESDFPIETLKTKVW